MPTRKTVFGCLVFFAACSITTLAADGQRNSPDPWSGFYMGVVLGNSVGEDDISGLGGAKRQDCSVEMSCIQSGVIVGWSRQFGRGVFGVEALLGAALADQSESTGDNLWGCKIDSDWQVSVRGKCGVLLTPELLVGLYAGRAYSQFDCVHYLDWGSSWGSNYEADGSDYAWQFGITMSYALTDRFVAVLDCDYSAFDGYEHGRWSSGYVEHSPSFLTLRGGLVYYFVYPERKSTAHNMSLGNDVVTDL